MASKTCWLHAACSVAALMLACAPAPARAEFFDDVRRTFQTDIPHFFQDDIPCAFGGQPTSQTKASCHDADRPARQAADRKVSAPPPTRAKPPPEAPRVREAPEYP